MSAHSSHGTHHGANHGPGYETTDASVPAIVRWGAGILILVAFSFGLMFLCFQLLDSIRTRLDPGRPTAMQLQSEIPNAPLLQVDQSLDLKHQRVKDAHTLESYARDEKSGAIRIPVDRAIELLSERGLPTPKGPPAAAAAQPVAAAKPAAAAKPEARKK